MHHTPGWVLVITSPGWHLSLYCPISHTSSSPSWSLNTDPTGQWMMQLLWHCTWGCFLWTLVMLLIPSSQLGCRIRSPSSIQGSMWDWMPWFRLSVDQHCFPSGLCTLSSAYLYTLTAAPPITTPLNSRCLRLTPRFQGSPQVGLSLEQHGAQCYQNSRDDTGLPAPPVPIFQHACPVEIIKSFHFLGTISQHLKWDLKISYFNKKPLPAPAEEI